MLHKESSDSGQEEPTKTTGIKFTKFNRKHTKNKKGFSLIELLVTVGIIGVLASVAIPAYNQYKRNAAEGAAENEVQNFRKSLEACMATGKTLANCATANIGGTLEVNCAAATYTAKTAANTLVTAGNACHWDITSNKACYDSIKVTGGYAAAHCISYNGNTDAISTEKGAGDGTGVIGGLCKTDGTCIAP